MIDLSDGLASDARKLAAASSKKIILDRNLIIAGSPQDNSLRAAFCDGEDFELLFTCNPKTASELELKFPWPCGLRRLGTVHEGDGVFLRDNLAINELEFSGYEH
jgi:thiamine-monophosphate kinase